MVTRRVRPVRRALASHPGRSACDGGPCGRIIQVAEELRQKETKISADAGRFARYAEMDGRD